MENIEVRAMRALDRNNQALFFRCGLLGARLAIYCCIASVVGVPNRQIFEVFVSHVGIISVLGVRENFFFLLLELSHKTINLLFDFAELLFVLQSFEVAIAHVRVNTLGRF